MSGSSWAGWSWQTPASGGTRTAFSRSLRAWAVQLGLGDAAGARPRAEAGEAGDQDQGVQDQARPHAGVVRVVGEQDREVARDGEPADQYDEAEREAVQVQHAAADHPVDQPDDDPPDPERGHRVAGV